MGTAGAGSGGMGGGDSDGAGGVIDSGGAGMAGSGGTGEPGGDGGSGGDGECNRNPEGDEFCDGETPDFYICTLPIPEACEVIGTGDTTRQVCCP